MLQDRMPFSSSAAYGGGGGGEDTGREGRTVPE